MESKLEQRYQETLVRFVADALSRMTPDARRSVEEIVAAEGGHLPVIVSHRGGSAMVIVSGVDVAVGTITDDELNTPPDRRDTEEHLRLPVSLDDA